MKEIKRPFNAQKALRVACLVLADLILINLSAFLALYIRFEFDFRQLYATTFLRDMLIYAGINSACTILIFHILKLYNSLWEFASVSELVRITLGCFFSAVFYMVGMFMLHLTVPRSFPAIYMLILCLLCGALRLSYRCVRRTRAGLRSEGEKRTMLIGGGQAGAIALREFQTSPRSENKVVCIIDDSPNKVGSYLRGVKIVGGRSSIPAMAEKYDVDEIVLAIPSASRQEKLQKDIGRLTESARRASGWSDRTEKSKFGVDKTGAKAADRGFVGHKAAKLMQRSKSIQRRRDAAAGGRPQRG